MSMWSEGVHGDAVMGNSPERIAFHVRKIKKEKNADVSHM